MVDCTDCGACCKLFLINLTEEEYKSGTFKTQFEEFGLIDDFSKAEECGANILAQKKDGSCIYLKDKLCSIHTKRPKHCREFFCDSKKKKYKGMIKEIKYAEAGI